MARKTKYETNVAPYLDKIKDWVRQGDTHKSIARKLKIHFNTLESYLTRGEKGEEPFCDFYECFAQGELDAIEEVENALKKRATGYQWTEITEYWKRDPKTGETVLAETRKRLVDVPPDPTSIQFYLINRKRADWQKDRKEVVTESRDDLGVIMLPEVIEE